MSGKDILIIEDSLTQVEHLRFILEKHGFCVADAANGIEAKELIKRKKPAVIISDVVMPEMDGYEFCRTLKASPEYGDVPVVLLTALSEPGDVVRGLECGADNFIIKPYDEEYLISLINGLCDKPVQRSEEPAPEPLQLHFAGKDYVLNADRRQILNLLLSTYQTAVQKNRELSKARDELHELNQQLKAANSELEAFSYTVSHDLRSPLNIIGLYAQALLEVCKKCGEGGGDYLDGIMAQVNRMSRLISTLLSFSRIMQGELHRADVDLSSVAREIAADLTVNHPERKARFIIADDVVVNGDPKLLRIVLVNLLGNAWKYSGKKEETVIEFGVREQGDRKVLFVRDNGVGFDQNAAQDLFKPFLRLHDPDEFPGTGVGLATVSRIIQRHGGKIWADGEVGKGAEFSFVF